MVGACPVLQAFSVCDRPREVENNASRKGVVERPDGSVVLKAFNGDRKANLESIANEMDEILNNSSSTSSGVELDVKKVHKLKGYANQLRIIAAEWKAF